MNKIIYFAVMAVIVGGLIPNGAYAKTAYVHILDKDLHTICDTNFSGTNGMDSVIKTAGKCGFTYELGFGGDYLNTVNNISWDGTNWWVLYVDGAYSNKGVNEYDLNDVSDIWWVFNDGSYVPPSVIHQKLMSTAGEGIVGLINPGTGGLIDSDGDGVSDVQERANGTDPNKSDKDSQVANAFTAVDSGTLTKLGHAILKLQKLIFSL